jgi:hypothetical protein
VVKGAVNLNRIKELAVIFQLVYLTGGVEKALPGAFTFRVRPARGADVDFQIIFHMFRVCGK